MAVVRADGEQVFAGLAVEGRGGNADLVMLPLGIRQAADGLDILPRASVERVLRVGDGRSDVLGGFEVGDNGWRGVHLEAVALLESDEGFAGTVRRAIGRNDLHLVPAIGK